MGTLIMISQFVLSLTILVVLHECGHFFPARWFKIRVEKFYLFFDPWFSLVKKKIGDTEYGIGWLPLGGYVKISGMVDESMDLEQLKQEPKPWEFRSKPAWQRLIIMVGGVFVNFMLGFFIFAMLLWKNGIEYLPIDQMKYGISVDSIGYSMGFRDGDQLVKAGDKQMDRFDRRLLIMTLLFDENSKVQVRRDGELLTIDVPQEKRSQLAKQEMKNKEIWGIRTPMEVDSLIPESAAQKAGIDKGDQILQIDGNSVQYVHEFFRLMKGKQPNSTLQITLLRNNDTLRLMAKTDENGKLGIYPAPFIKFMTTQKENFGLLESLPKGVEAGVDLLVTQLKAFRQMFAGKIEAKDSLGGFASIAKMFDTTWNWTSFWKMTAVLSIILGFMNLLPIPGLDGGYVVFLMIEVISGRKVPDKIIEKATLVGFILLMALLLYANGLDVFRAFGK
ncbi:MAG: RIP metalloprotease RseP [Saprospiraceae bacterium]|nr:RIP metalloprotease RseP [Saprospiraceae bacterium]